MTSTNHALKLTIGNPLGLVQDIECTEPDTAECRRWCNLPECDGGPSSEHDSHDLITVPCSIREWFLWDTAASIEGYTGQPTDLRSGPIVITQAGEDGFEWHYADPEPHASGSAS